MGASEKLINYLTHTPNNTNLNIVPQLIDGGAEDSNLIAITYEDAYVCYFADGTIEKDGNIIDFANYNKIKDIMDNHEEYEAFVEFGDKRFEIPWKTEHDDVMFWLDEIIDDGSYTAYISLGPETKESGEEMQSVSIGTECYKRGSYEPIKIETKIYIQHKTN